MSDYDMTFDKKITADQTFDTIFGGEEDNHLLDLVLKEDADAFNVDERDPESVEDGVGAIGKGTGIGSDVGPDHDANKPTDDSSDQKTLTTDKELAKNSQLNISDTTGEKVEDGDTVDTDDVHASGTDELVGNDPIPEEDKIDDNLDKIADKVDSFDEAMLRLLEEVGDDELPTEEPEVAPATAPAAPVNPAAEVPTTPDAEPVVPAPAPDAAPVDVSVDVDVPASNGDAVEDIDLLDTDPVDSPDEGCCKESDEEVEDDDEEVADVGDLDEASLEDDVDDKVDFGGVEDKLGKIGAGEGLGNDVGPDHDTNNKPKDDSSDEDVLPKDDIELVDDQLNTSDEAGANKVEDGDTVDPKDAANVGEDGKSASDSFKEASVEDLEDLPEDEEDDVIDAVEDNDAKSEFSAAELNADEDDEILNMLD